MSETIVVCPQCQTKIRVDEQLAAPLLKATRDEYERRLADKDKEAAERGAKLDERALALQRAEAEVESTVSRRLDAERQELVREEARKAEARLGERLGEQSRQVAELLQELQTKEGKLAEAQQAQAAVLRRERELADAKRELDLTVETRVTEQVETLRSQARNEAGEEYRLKVSEKEQTIASMQRQIEELKRRAEQGSQQLQGEVQEIELETLLRLRFPLDHIEPVAKGEQGGDILHCVNTPQGLKCGAILWEAKRAKNWSDGWLVKLREDQRRVKAELAILVSPVLPKGVETFDFLDGVWVVHPRAVIPVTLSLRQTLLEVSVARQAAQGQEGKATLVYQYLTGPRFRQRIQAIVEAFTTMQGDLDKERRAILKQWAKREEQIGRVMQSTAEMFGDLQGIAGKSLQEIEGLDIDVLSLEDGSCREDSTKALSEGEL